MRRLFVVLLSYFVLVSCSSGQEQQRQMPESLPNDLANALVQMARRSRTPLVAELAQPLPKITTFNGAAMTPDALDQLVKVAPGYAWRMEGKTVYFYCSELRNAKYNFLNLTFPRFTIPANVSDFKLWFPARAVGLLEGHTAEGAAISGFGDSLLSKQPLQQATLENVTPLQALFHVANESPTFYSVLVFPSAAPSRSDAEKHVSWNWGSLNEPPKPIYIQPVPR